MSPNFGHKRDYISNSISRYIINPTIACSKSLLSNVGITSCVKKEWWCRPILLNITLKEDQYVGPHLYTCVDFLNIRIAKFQVNDITCGTLDTVDQIQYDGDTSLIVEFVTNRETVTPGVNLHVYCRNPDADANIVNSNSEKRRRNIDDCTSPNGDGPRDEPFNPPPVSNLLFQFTNAHCIYSQAQRIQKILDRDPSAMFGMLEMDENLTYIDNTVILSNGTIFMNINNLTVENRIQTKTISRSSIGSYGGFGKNLH